MQAGSSQKPTWSTRKGPAPLASSLSRPAADLLDAETARHGSTQQTGATSAPRLTFQDALSGLDAPQRRGAVDEIDGGVALQQGLAWKSSTFQKERVHPVTPRPAGDAPTSRACAVPNTVMGASMS